MPAIKLSTSNLITAKLGTSQVAKIMLGDTQLWPNGGYGLLYNYYACIDSRNIANTGWHMPSIAEWDDLISGLGYTDAGGKLKQTGLLHWLSPNTGATNSSEFGAVGAGTRHSSGWSDLNTKCYFQSATFLYGDANNITPPIQYNSAEIASGPYGGQRYFGFPVRLIKDTTSLVSQGQPGTYTDNSGNTYPTVLIGPQEWICVNLRDTKYRNGDPIPEITDQTAWNARTAGAWCYYNNDANNL